jgi:hypothetical protein
LRRCEYGFLGCWRGTCYLLVTWLPKVIVPEDRMVYVSTGVWPAAPRSEAG